MARRKLRNLDARIIKKVIFYGAKDGVDAISTKRIAKDLGITEPTIYVHFDTKNNLLYSAYTDALDKILDLQTAIIEEAKEYDNEEGLGLHLWKATLQHVEEEKEAFTYIFRYRHNFPPMTFAEQPTVTSFLLEYYPANETENILEKEIVITELAELILYEVALGQLPANDLTAKATLAILQNGAYNWKQPFKDSLTEEDCEQLDNNENNIFKFND